MAWQGKPWPAIHSWTIGLERIFIFSNSLATGVQNVPEMRVLKSSAVGGNKDQDAKDSTPLEQRIETAKKDTLQDRQLLKGRVPQGRYWRNSFSNLLKIFILNVHFDIMQAYGIHCNFFVQPVCSQLIRFDNVLVGCW